MIRDRSERKDAEIAIAVADGWHRRGMGRELLQALIRRGDALGIERVHAWVLAGNTAALGLFWALSRVVWLAEIRVSSSCSVCSEGAANGSSSSMTSSTNFVS